MKKINNAKYMPLFISVLFTNVTYCAQKTDVLSADIGNAVKVLSKTVALRTATQPMPVKAKDEKKTVVVTTEKVAVKVELAVAPRDSRAIIEKLCTEAIECNNNYCKSNTNVYKSWPDYLPDLLMHVHHSRSFARQRTDSTARWQPLHVLKIDSTFIQRVLFCPPSTTKISFCEKDRLVCVFLNNRPQIFDIDSGRLIFKQNYFLEIELPYEKIDCASETQKYRAYTTQGQKQWKNNAVEIVIYKNNDWTAKE